jgi:hypothetical protein
MATDRTRSPTGQRELAVYRRDLATRPCGSTDRLGGAALHDRFQLNLRGEVLHVKRAPESAEDRQSELRRTRTGRR